MYGRPGVIYGFHGCDRRVGEVVLASHTQHLKASKNDYDWLGHGIYFWEASPERALEFAREAKARGKISHGKIRFSYVVGAVIETSTMTPASPTRTISRFVSAATSTFAAASESVN